MKTYCDAVIFDIGNTLIDTNSIMKIALLYTAEQLKTKNVIKDIGDFREIYYKVDKKIEGIDVNHLYSCIQILKCVAEELNIRQKHLFYFNFINIYREKIKISITHNISAIKIFEKLTNLNIKIGIVSDGTTYEQIEQLYLLGLLDYIDEIVTSQEIGVEKPDVKIYNAILNRLECYPENSIMVGDDIVRDIGGANKLGMKTVLLTQYLQKESIKNNIANYTINSIEEIIKIISYYEN
jgi:HAD superfamily hydrolase (TIGR01549 family)